MNRPVHSSPADLNCLHELQRDIDALLAQYSCPWFPLTCALVEAVRDVCAQHPQQDKEEERPCV